jgi:O-antigen/teichoic acid export membrane protein
MDATIEHPRPAPGISDASESGMPARSSLVRTVGSNAVAQLAAQVATIGATVIVSAMLSRHLGPAGYGQYSLIFASVTLLAAFFADVGLPQIAARDASQSPDDLGGILASAAVLQLVASVVAYLALLVAAGFMLDASDLMAVVVAGILILLLPLDIVAVVFLVKLRLVRIAWIGVVASVARVFMTWGAVVAGAGLTAMVIVSTVGACLRYGLLPFALRGVLQWRTLIPQRHRFRELLVAIAPLAIATSCLSVMSQLPIFFLNWLSSPDQVGFFSAAQKVSAYATAPTGMVTASLYPLFSQLAASNRPRLVHLSGQSLRFMLLAALPIAVSGLIAGPWLMPLVYGDAFEPASGPFAILMIQAAVVTAGTLVTHILIAMSRQRTVLVGVGIGAVVSVVTCLSLGQILGAVGAATGLLAGTLAASVYVLIVLLRALGGDLPMRGGRLLGVAGVLVAGTAIASAVLPLSMASAIGFAGCIVAAIVLGAVDRTDIQVFIDAVRVRRERQNEGGGADGDRRL